VQLPNGGAAFTAAPEEPLSGVSDAQAAGPWLGGRRIGRLGGNLYQLSRLPASGSPAPGGGGTAGMPAVDRLFDLAAPQRLPRDSPQRRGPAAVQRVGARANSGYRSVPAGPSAPVPASDAGSRLS